MRDLFVTLVVFASLPVIVARPYIGILVWSWLAYMNPHRLAWGFATTMPFALMVAVAIFIGMLFSKEPKRLPWTRETIILLIFVVWMLVTTVGAMYPWLAWPEWDKVWRIQLMTFVTMMLMFDRRRIHLLVWTIVLSLGFYGVKGGIWVLSTGGAHNVMGPPGSFIGGNNEIGLALIMTVPLMRYLQLTTASRWVKHGMTAAMMLMFIAIVGTHSRGALLGIAAMALFFLIKTRRRLLPLLLLGVFIAFLPRIMPQHWFERMHTIETYQEDNSAQSRLRAWRHAYAIVQDRPVLGGGYNVLIGQGETDAHSIYFEVLGEHGYIGLVLFLLLALFTWRSGAWVIKNSKRIPEMRWAGDLASMLQVSMVGYASAGAFLGLAYFDLYYHLIAIMVLTRQVVEQQVRANAECGHGTGDEAIESDVAVGEYGAPRSSGR